MRNVRSARSWFPLLVSCSLWPLSVACGDSASDDSPETTTSESDASPDEHPSTSDGADSSTGVDTTSTGEETGETTGSSEPEPPSTELDAGNTAPPEKTDEPSTPDAGPGEAPVEAGPAEPTDPVDGGLADVTWHQQIAPLVHTHCVGCHTAGGIAPFTLDTYENAKPWAGSMYGAVASGLMPPWGAENTETCEPRFGWKDDIRLSAAEVALLGAWAELGAPEGDPEAAEVLPTPPELALTDPDLNIQITTPVEISGEHDQFLCFSVPTDLGADAWITATQIVPGNNKIVHHVLTYLDADGASAALADENGRYDCFGGPGVDDAELIGAWAPGGVAWRTPSNVAMSLPQGARVIMNVHYHPTHSSTETDDSTHLQLELSDTAPDYVGSIALVGNFAGTNLFGGLQAGPNDPEDGVEFRIPAGAQGHTETMTFRVPPTYTDDISIWAVGTHMHYVGTDMSIQLTRAEPEAGEPDAECLLQTPRWDFDWQRGYLYDAPFEDLPKARAGDTLTFTCVYDNTMSNPKVVEALEAEGLSEPHDVVLGENTLDEMCLGAFGIATPR
jgi:hypothetical protein